MNSDLALLMASTSVRCSETSRASCERSTARSSAPDRVRPLARDWPSSEATSSASTAATAQPPGNGLASQNSIMGGKKTAA